MCVDDVASERRYRSAKLHHVLRNILVMRERMAKRKLGARPDAASAPLPKPTPPVADGNSAGLSLNILTDQWIPARLSDNTSAMISPLDIFDTAKSPVTTL